MESWSDKRNRLFLRDNYTCRRCRIQTGILSLHHIRPRAKFGTDEDTNLITLCITCHDWVELSIEFDPLLKTREGIMNSLPSVNYKLVKNLMTMPQPGERLLEDRIDIWVRWVSQDRKGAKELLAQYRGVEKSEETQVEIKLKKPSKGMLLEEEYRKMFK